MYYFDLCQEHYTEFFGSFYLVTNFIIILTLLSELTNVEFPREKRFHSSPKFNIDNANIHSISEPVLGLN